MHFISREEVQRREPAVVAKFGALESPGTGIVDSHSLMQHLHGAFEDAGGDVALTSRVSAIIPISGGKPGYKITVDSPSGETAVITADTVINAAGLGAIAISNLLLPPDRHTKAYFCKGTYFSYSASRLKVNTLLYPAPVKGLGGLGTHLTLDIAGRIRFGPDVEWVDNPTDLAPNAARMSAAVQAIRMYLPRIEAGALSPDYCGMRPKIAPEGAGGVGQVDFVIREEKGFAGFINLLGIESPGEYTGRDGGAILGTRADVTALFI